MFLWAVKECNKRFVTYIHMCHLKDYREQYKTYSNVAAESGNGKWNLCHCDWADKILSLKVCESVSCCACRGVLIVCVCIEECVCVGAQLCLCVCVTAGCDGLWFMGCVPQCQRSVCSSMEDEWTSVSPARTHRSSLTFLSQLSHPPFSPPPFSPNMILQLATDKLRATVYLFL